MTTNSGEEILRAYAMSQLGKPYIWGGDDTITGWDCSGICLELLTASGVWPAGKDATAQGLYNHFRGHGESDRFGFGSLVFYGRITSAITHVAFGLDSRYVLEAGGGGRTTVTPQAAAKDNAWVRVRPINHRPDMLASIRPAYPF